MKKIAQDDPETSIHVSVALTMVQMERLLRGLRASANCYVSEKRLKEVDDFLNQK